MNKLQLILKKEWFDMILSGEKKEEYRDLTSYWFRRLTGAHILKEKDGVQEPCPDDCVYDTLSQNPDQYKEVFSKFDSVIFYLGYAKNRPKMEVEIKDIRIDDGIKDWGAKPDKYYFVIRLGDILSVKRYDNKQPVGRIDSDVFPEKFGGES